MDPDGVGVDPDLYQLVYLVNSRQLETRRPTREMVPVTRRFTIIHGGGETAPRARKDAPTQPLPRML